MRSEPIKYPQLPKDAKTYRLQIVENIQNDLKEFLNLDELSRQKAEKKHAKLIGAAGLLGSAGTAVSIAGGTIGATMFA